MNDNELKYARMVAIKNIVLIVATACVICCVAAATGSLFSLLGILMLKALTIVKTS